MRRHEEDTDVRTSTAEMGGKTRRPNPYNPTYEPEELEWLAS